MREEVKAGLLIVVSLLLLSGFIILIGGGRLLEKFDTYTVRVMNSAGLEVGSQVRLGGVRVGRIMSISAPAGPGEPITMEIGLRRGTVLYKGTRALITQIGFVGDIYLLLAVDRTVDERLHPGEEIPSEEAVGFGSLMSRVEELSISLDDLIRDADQVFSQKNLDGIENLVENTNKTIVSVSTNLDMVSIGLKRTTEKLEMVLNEIEEVVLENKEELSRVIIKAREDLEKAGTMIDNIGETAQAVDSAVDLQSRNLDILFETLTRTTEDLQEVLLELKNKPWSVLYRERGEN